MNLKKSNYKALMVGCGKMGSALLTQWAQSPALEFTIIDPQNVSLLAGVRGYSNLDELRTDIGEDQKFDILIAAIKPQLIDRIMSEYEPLMSETGLVLSIAAGCSAARLSDSLNCQSVIRIMPNLPAFIGQAMSGIYATSAVDSDGKAIAEHMMGLAGGYVWVEDEDGIDRITAIAGSGPGYIFEFARCYVAAAQSLGFTEKEASDLVLGTMAGTIEMARRSPDTLTTLRNNVTSKNGTTEAGLKALNQDDVLTQKLHGTVQAAYQRAVELR